VETPEVSREVLFRRAQHLVLALERLAAAVTRETQDAARAAELIELRQPMRWEGEFDAAKFRARLAGYRASLTGTPAN